jgi:hypothetical protein
MGLLWGLCERRDPTTTWKTLAVALSYDVLRRLGYVGYLLETKAEFLKQLPPEPQEALASHNRAGANSFWSAKVKTQKGTTADGLFRPLVLCSSCGSPEKWTGSIF